MKNTLVFSLLSAALCMTLCAQPAPVPATGTAKAALTKAPRIVDPAARSNLLARTGGIVQSPAEGPAILFLNAQSLVTENTLRMTTEQFQKTLHLRSLFSTIKSAEPIAEGLKALSDKNTAAVIVIGASEGYPTLLVAPESRWALVNVSALAERGVSATTLSERTQKEIWRAAGILMGAANSNFEHCLLKPVFSTSDLDALKMQTLSPEPFGKMLVHAQKMGMKAIRTTTYRKAVEEGWAPLPTNDFQRAIWSELKK